MLSSSRVHFTIWLSYRNATYVKAHSQQLKIVTDWLSTGIRFEKLAWMRQCNANSIKLCFNKSEPNQKPVASKSILFYYLYHFILAIKIILYNPYLRNEKLFLYDSYLLVYSFHFQPSIKGSTLCFLLWFMLFQKSLALPVFHG